MSPNASVVNHIGHCVADVGRARRFYEEVFGFRMTRELSVPDGPASTLLRVPPPVGLTATYLELGGTVLELLHFDRPADAERHERVFTEPGLTHLSFSVDDVAATCASVTEHGGTVLADTDIGGLAVMVRDPDGQLLELLATGLVEST